MVLPDHGARPAAETPLATWRPSGISDCRAFACSVFVELGQLWPIDAERRDGASNRRPYILDSVVYNRTENERVPVTCLSKKVLAAVSMPYERLITLATLSISDPQKDDAFNGSRTGNHFLHRIYSKPVRAPSKLVRRRRIAFPDDFHKVPIVERGSRETSPERDTCRTSFGLKHF
jgi:hypothetical protein